MNFSYKAPLTYCLVSNYYIMMSCENTTANTVFINSNTENIPGIATTTINFTRIG